VIALAASAAAIAKMALDDTRKVAIPAILATVPVIISDVVDFEPKSSQPRQRDVDTIGAYATPTSDTVP
jgi:hypothetical protein